MGHELPPGGEHRIELGLGGAGVEGGVNRSIIDIFSSRSNIALDCSRAIENIEDYLERDSIDDLETGIDLLKTLV